MSDDARLVEAARGGDPDAFGELVRRHDAMVRGVIRRSGAVASRAEDDLSQRAFLTAYEKLQGLDDARRFEAWLWGITSRLCWRWTAEEGRRGAAKLEDVAEPPAPGPELSSAERVEIRDRIADAVVGLPERQQAVVLLRYLDGLLPAEIATVLELTPGQVRGALYRGTQTLRQRLRDLWEELQGVAPDELLPEEIEELLEHASAAVMVITDELDVMAVNDPYSRATGYPASSVTGRKCYEVNHGRTSPCDGTDHPCPLRMIGDGQEQVRVQHRHRQRDGTWRTVDLLTHPVDQELPDGSRRRFYVELITPGPDEGGTTP